MLLALLHLLHDSARFLAQAVTVLPIVLLIAKLLAKTKGHALGQDLLKKLSSCALKLWIFGPLHIVASFALLPAHLSATGHEWVLPDLRDPAVLNYTASIGLWLLALPLLVGVHRLVQRAAHPKILTAILLCLLACFFLCNVTIHWPFAGLPEGLSAHAAFWAICVKAEHTLFYALFPCGMVLLVCIPQKDEVWHFKAAAIIACIGALPTLLSSAGIFTGYFFRPTPLHPQLYPALAHTIFLLATVSTLIPLIFAKQRQNLFRRAALLLVVLDLITQALLPKLLSA